jgi:hypothetical protein
MNLFNELAFETFTQIAINKAIEKVNESDILHTDLKEEAKKIVDSLTFTVPAIKQSGITSSLSMEDKEGTTYAEHHENLKNNDVFATATYSVPFHGNVEIFKVKPLDYQEGAYHDLDFDIESDHLKFKIRTASEHMEISEEWKSHLIATSMEIINFIEDNLRKLSTHFLEFKNEMIGPVITSLNERKEELLKARLIAKEVNIFNDNGQAE